MDKTEKAKKIITSNLYMTIATVTKDGLPWNTPVYYAFDESYAFYWYSRKNTKHSQLIAENSNVAVAIFDLSPIVKI